ncbi:hypothetical protein BJ741DRAFT_61608 [Chytriomyces cf. hyalinus JEL632]|nr:hypothetical protein BJ741DRAFT_61608 [Chytriomyces cf. hyalinus JEL632]
MAWIDPTLSCPHTVPVLCYACATSAPLSITDAPASFLIALFFLLVPLFLSNFSLWIRRFGRCRISSAWSAGFVHCCPQTCFENGACNCSSRGISVIFQTGSNTKAGYSVFTHCPSFFPASNHRSVELACEKKGAMERPSPSVISFAAFGLSWHSSKCSIQRRWKLLDQSALSLIL